ncbi:MAG: phosphoribosyl-ATP diphosphatase [Xanthobacteraceae bacterium]|nr:phosphoribosyl-ATP diphosphatase [Xanthobacteraceae bacterium]MBX3534889.1 phosphoribosyl-ATP diphosphatase [Xanthobacteraceae bacterium]MBX3549541.1 phosphoribosyl-ATP diphosphatase [Xanthobacteraceae bacterium]MCW5673239.1 phosphoribosyl-ATP diphosphatase [Xanthobacteraceae bacterium]MCW5677648.1 phosphoribosyl-ATP diphosphatase [Xanthobacteraceae bacterium]
MANFTLEDLAKIIAARAGESADKSYTRKLLDAGVEKCAKKLGEEATETIIAATSGTKEQTVAESADLLYHLLVVLKARGVDLSEVYAELSRRTAQSGLEEKASRSK